jgi:hypothetical protein
MGFYFSSRLFGKSVIAPHAAAATASIYAACTVFFLCDVHRPQSLHQLNPSRASFGAAASLEIGSNYDVLFFMLNWQSATDLRYSLYGM